MHECAHICKLHTPLRSEVKLIYSDVPVMRHTYTEKRNKWLMQ